MKLIDILALELRAWPKGFGKSVGQCHHGAIHSCGLPYLQSGQKFTRCDNYMTDVVSRGQWQAAVDALKAEARPTESMALHHQEVGRITRQWNGEGLPPVGVVCEYRGAHQFDAWSEVRIFAEWGHGSSKVVFFDFGDGWREERSPDKFRTVRTQDQIEEMRLSVKEMCAVALTTPVVTCDQAEIIMRRLYDAGYRKFEIVDN